MATSIGPKIKIEGEAEYRRQIELLTQRGKQLDSQMKLVTSSFDKSTTAQQKAAETTKILTQRIEAQEKQVEAMTGYYQKGQAKLQEYADTLQAEIDLHGEDSAAAAKARDEYDRYSIALGKVEINLNKAKTSLNDMQRELDESTAAAQDMGDAAEDASKQVDKSADAVQDMGDAAEDAGENFEEAGAGAASFGDVLRANLLSSAIMDGLKKIADLSKEFAKGAINAAAELKAESAQFAQTFGELGSAAESELAQISAAAGILPQRLRGAYTQFFAYARSSGMESAAALEFATKATYAAADAAAYYDRSLEDATEQVLAYTKGNFANDAALGFASTEATRNAQALQSLGKEYKDLDVTAGETTQVLLDQIISAQKLSGALGQASRESDGWENVTGNLSATWEKFQGKIGRPVLDNLVPRVQKITKSFDSWQDSLDMRKVNKTVDALFDNIEKYGPQIIKTATAIGKSIAAWNIAQLSIKGGQAFTAFAAKVKSGGGIIQTALTAAGGGLGGFVSLAVTAMPLAVAAYDALAEATKSSTQRAIEETEARVESVQKSRQAFAELQATQLEAAQGELAQIDRVQALAQELDMLADSTGNVQEKDRARAEFIVGQLNEALGLELEMIEGQIQGYDQLQQSIQATIEQKRFSILLDAQMETYNEALSRQSDLTRDQAIAANELQTQQAKVNDMMQLANSWQKAIDDDNQELISSYQQLYATRTDLVNDLNEEQRKLEVLDAAYSEHTAALEENYSVIKAVEDAQAENMAGNTEEAIRILQNLSSAYAEQTNVYTAEAEERKRIAAENYGLALVALNDYLQRVKRGQTQFSQSLLNELMNTATSAQKEAENVGVQIDGGIVKGLDDHSFEITSLLKSIAESGVEEVKNYESDFEWAGKKIGEGVTRGIDSQVSAVAAAAGRLAGAAHVNFNRTLQIHSPSRVMYESGVNTALGSIEGMLSKVGEIRQASAMMASAVLKGYSAPQLPAIYAPGVQQAAAGRSAAEVPSVGSITIQVYGHEGQDENAIADAVASKLQSMVARREVVWQ